jgi:hypothetical protein
LTYYGWLIARTLLFKQTLKVGYEHAQDVQTILAGWLDMAAGVFWLLAVGLLTLLIVGFSVGFGMPQGVVRLLRPVGANPGAGTAWLYGNSRRIVSIKRHIWLIALIGSISIIPTGSGIASVILLVLSENEFA